MLCSLNYSSFVLNAIGTHGQFGTTLTQLNMSGPSARACMHQDDATGEAAIRSYNAQAEVVGPCRHHVLSKERRTGRHPRVDSGRASGSSACDGGTVRWRRDAPSTEPHTARPAPSGTERSSSLPFMIGQIGMCSLRFATAGRPSRVPIPFTRTCKPGMIVAGWWRRDEIFSVGCIARLCCPSLLFIDMSYKGISRLTLDSVVFDYNNLCQVVDRKLIFFSLSMSI
jgi:hypothetical protein